MRKLLTLFLLVFLCIATGCSSIGKSGSISNHFYKTTDVAGNELVLEKKPERIIILAPSFLNIMHAVGGDFIAWANSPSDPPPAYAKNKKTVGYTYQVNVEEIISEKPDLVIGLNGLHNRLTEVMKQNGIPFLLLSASSVDDVKHAARVLGDVTGRHKEGLSAANKLQDEIDRVVQNYPRNDYTCAILHGTPHAVTLEGKGTIATETAALLHIRNVFVQENDHDMKLPPFSLETLVSKDPDIIFLTTMVMPGQQQEAFRNSLLSQPVWAKMRAVKEGHVYFLPQNLFLSSPGMDYPKALSYMAHLVYGEK